MINKLLKQNNSNSIEDFQKANNLKVDGIAGKDTLFLLQKNVIKKQKLIKVKCNKLNNNSLGSAVLRDDVAVQFKKVLKDVNDKGGQITSSGGIRKLKVRATKGRSSTSFHYPAIAFDNGINDGFFDPQNDNYIITKSNKKDRYFDVWIKTYIGEPKTLDALKWGAKRWKTTAQVQNELIAGIFLNLTDIFIKHGFEPIRPRKSYFATNKNYLATEWWHFQFKLEKGISQFGIELLKIYDANKIPTHFEKHFKRIYKKDWN